MSEPKSWRVIVLSTGELPIEAKLGEERRRKAKAGQLVRMLDVQCNRAFGVFDDAGSSGDAGNLAKAFRTAATSAYGTAGPEFVRRLIAEDVTSDELRMMVSDFVETATPSGAVGQVARAAQRLGLIAVAAELAAELGVVPWQPGEANAAAAWALRCWVEGRGGTQPAEVRQAVEQIRLIIEQHGESRFEALDDTEARPVANRLGWRKGAGASREWMVPSEIWKAEICAGLDAKMVARVLAERGMVERANDGFQPVRKIGGAKNASTSSSQPSSTGARMNLK